MRTWRGRLLPAQITFSILSGARLSSTTISIIQVRRSTRTRNAIWGNTWLALVSGTFSTNAGNLPLVKSIGLLSWGGRFFGCVCRVQSRHVPKGPIDASRQAHQNRSQLLRHRTNHQNVVTLPFRGNRVRDHFPGHCLLADYHRSRSTAPPQTRAGP